MGIFYMPEILKKKLYVELNINKLVIKCVVKNIQQVVRRMYI